MSEEKRVSLERALNEALWDEVEKTVSDLMRKISEYGEGMTIPKKDLCGTLVEQVASLGRALDKGENREVLLKGLTLLGEVIGRDALGDDLGAIALGRAVLYDDVEVVKTLISLGANPNAHGIYSLKETAIIQAVEAGASKCLDEMLDSVKEPVRGTRSEISPLLESCRALARRGWSRERELCVIRLCSLEYEESEWKAEYEKRMMEPVAKTGSESVLRALKKAGHKSEGKGFEAHEFASCRKEWTPALSRCAKLLVSAGEDLNAQFYGETPLMAAIRQGNEGAGRALVEAGARLDIGKAGVLPHEEARASSSPEFASFLLARYEDSLLEEETPKNSRKLSRRL